MNNKLYASCTGILDANIMSVSVNGNHDAAVSIATVICSATTLDIGNAITIDLGYDDDHGVVFTGYVKQIERKVMENVYTITAHDVLVRAVDYFIASSDPEKPFTRRKISAEHFVKDLLDLPGLDLLDDNVDASGFTLAVGMDAEVNLIGCYDYCKSIADLITWQLYADESGNLMFKNRKPYVMTGNSGQLKDDIDERNPAVAIGVIDDTTNFNITSIAKEVNETDLRNRIVIYGHENKHSESKSATSYDPLTDSSRQILPADYYKTVVFASDLITSTALAKQACDYNLEKLNRLGYMINVTTLGNHKHLSKKIITVDESILGLTTRNWYIFSSEMSWNKSGFVNNMMLKL